MERRWGWIGVAVVLFGCGPGPEPASDGGPTPDGGGICCPIEIHEGTPCGCWRIGGHAPTLAECPQHCDGANYSQRTDEHGCTVLDYYGLGSCLPEPDVGLGDDAGISDDASVSDDGGVTEDDAP